MPSNNTFVNAQSAAKFVAWDGLEQLLNKLAIGSYFSDEHASDFAQKQAIGRAMAIPFSQRYIVQRNDMSFNAQALDRPFVNFVMDQTATIPIQWESIENALDMERGKERVRELYIQPMVNYMLQAIETDLATFACRMTNMVSGALGTNPTSYDATSAAGLQALQEMGGHTYGELGLFVPPSVNRAVKTNALAYFNPQTDISKQFREGYIGRSDSFDWYSSMSLPTHTAGTWASSVTCNGANQTGASLAVNCTSGDTFKFGDKISIANVNQVNLMTRDTTSTSSAGSKVFTITADVTASASTATLPIWPPIYGPGSHYQNVDALNVANAALTLWPGTTSPNGKSGKLALAMAKGAFFVAGAKLQQPKGSVEFCEVAKDPNTGIELRIIQQYIGGGSLSDTMITRADCCWGRGVGLSEQCSVVLPCA